MEHEQNNVPYSTMPPSPTNAPVSFYGDNSRNTDGALLAAMATKDYSYDEAGMLGAYGVSDLRSEVKDVGSNVRSDVKDAECNIRHDVTKAESEIRRDVAKAEADIRADILREGQENMAATKDAECHISKEILESKFATTKEILETKHILGKDILRSEYENKLAIQAAIKEINSNAQHNAERTQDKIDHGFEEINEKLCECCGEAAVVATQQTGFLNLLVDALKVK